MMELFLQSYFQKPLKACIQFTVYYQRLLRLNQSIRSSCEDAPRRLERLKNHKFYRNGCP